jgi:hypothetical protein
MGWSQRGRKSGITIGKRGSMKPEPRELEVGAASRANEDGSWSIKLQIDNIPNQDVAEALASWLYDLVCQEVDRAINARERKLQ